MMVCRLLCSLIVGIALPGSGLTLKAQESTPEPLAGTIRAQIRASVLAPLVGEPVEITLIVDLPPGAELVEWPEIGDTWGAFAVYSAGELESSGEINAGLRLSQALQVRLWEPGDYETPETFVGYRLRFSDEVFFAPFTPVFFTVPSVLDQMDLVLRPLAPPVSLFYVPPWLLFSLVGLLVTLGWVGRVWWRRRRLRHEPAPVILETPEQVALRGLRELNDVSLPTVAVVDGVSTVLRAYLEQRHAVNALKSTTSQVMAWLLDSGDMSANDLAELGSLLDEADHWRFMGEVPSVATAAQLLNRAYRWVQAQRIVSGPVGSPA